MILIEERLKELMNRIDYMQRQKSENLRSGRSIFRLNLRILNYLNPGHKLIKEMSDFCVSWPPEKSPPDVIQGNIAN